MLSFYLMIVHQVKIEFKWLKFDTEILQQLISLIAPKKHIESSPSQKCKNYLMQRINNCMKCDDNCMYSHLLFK